MLNSSWYAFIRISRTNFYSPSREFSEVYYAWRKQSIYHYFKRIEIRAGRAQSSPWWKWIVLYKNINIKKQPSSLGSVFWSCDSQTWYLLLLKYGKNEIQNNEIFWFVHHSQILTKYIFTYFSQQNSITKEFSLDNFVQEF